MFDNRITRLLGVEIPIVQAPMGWIARAQLEHLPDALQRGGGPVEPTEAPVSDAVLSRVAGAFNMAGLIVLGWLVHHTSAGIGRFDPKNYRSPSGEFTLSVEPSDRFGRGATRYALIRDGVRLWARDHPFALQDAAVTDEGWVVGWAQTKDESVTPSVNLYLHFVLDEAGEVARRDQWSLAQPRVDFGGRVRFSIDAHGAFALEDRRGVLVVRGANGASGQFDRSLVARLPDGGHADCRVSLASFAAPDVRELAPFIDRDRTSSGRSARSDNMDRVVPNRRPDAAISNLRRVL